MDFEAMALKDYYFLKRGESFSIDPWRDASVYFGDATLCDRIQRKLESDFQEKGAVPKFYIFGEYGSGKTHTLAHISHVLGSSSRQKADPVFTSLPPLHEKESWQRVHARFMDALGPERVNEAVSLVADRISGPDKIKGLLEGGYLRYGDETLRISQANVFRNFLFGGRQAQLSWEWMKGRQNNADQATMLGVQKDLEEPSDFVDCMLNVGCLSYLATGKKLVFLLDEAEAFRNVTKADAMREMQAMLVLLLDPRNSHVGLILAIQAESGQETIGEFFGREDLYRRIGYERGVIDLAGMVSQVASSKTFMLHVLEYLIDQDRAEETIGTEKLQTSKAYFPFVEAGLDAIATHISDNPTQASPSYILSTMSGAAIEAWRRRSSSAEHVLVTPEIVEECIYPGR